MNNFDPSHWLAFGGKIGLIPIGLFNCNCGVVHLLWLVLLGRCDGLGSGSKWRRGWRWHGCRQVGGKWEGMGDGCLTVWLAVFINKNGMGLVDWAWGILCLCFGRILVVGLYNTKGSIWCCIMTRTNFAIFGFLRDWTCNFPKVITRVSFAKLELSKDYFCNSRYPGTKSAISWKFKDQSCNFFKSFHSGTNHDNFWIPNGHCWLFFQNPILRGHFCQFPNLRDHFCQFCKILLQGLFLAFCDSPLIIWAQKW